MSEIDSGGMAFPVTPTDCSGQIGPTEYGLTKREYAAIELRVPNSGTDWLDEMIRKALHNDFAGMALQGILQLLGSVAVDFGGPERTAKMSYDVADAMIRAGKGEEK